MQTPLLTNIQSVIENLTLTVETVNAEIKQLEHRLDHETKILRPALLTCNESLNSMNERVQKELTPRLLQKQKQQVQNQDKNENNNNNREIPDPVSSLMIFTHRITSEFDRLQDRLNKNCCKRLNRLNSFSEQIHQTLLSVPDRSSSSSSSSCSFNSNSSHSSNSSSSSCQAARVSLRAAFEEATCLESDEEGAATLQLVQSILTKKIV